MGNIYSYINRTCQAIVDSKPFAISWVGLLYLLLPQYYFQIINTYGRLPDHRQHLIWNVPYYHFFSITYILILFLYQNSIIAWLRCMFTDPGQTTDSQVNSKLKNKLPEELNKTCLKCLIPKPPRSQHCSKCRKCVHRMDHHCNFTANCVGTRNYKFFQNWLVFTYLLCWAIIIINLVEGLILINFLTKGNWKYIWQHAIQQILFLGQFIIICLLCFFSGSQSKDISKVFVLNQSYVEQLKDIRGKNFTKNKESIEHQFGEGNWLQRTLPIAPINLDNSLFELAYGKRITPDLLIPIREKNGVLSTKKFIIDARTEMLLLMEDIGMSSFNFTDEINKYIDNSIIIFEVQYIARLIVGIVVQYM